MLRTLYSRLALTLFLILSIVGFVLIQVLGQSTQMYQQEVTQKLNQSLATHIATDQQLMNNGQVQNQVLEGLFHNLMVINPSIELYLLDKSGTILSYSAPPNQVKQSRVDLEPIRTFIKGTARFPHQGDDPKNPHLKKVFSATEIVDNGTLQGYLYIVLGGRQYDEIVAASDDSYILDSTLSVFLAALITSLIAGLILFAFQTRRLRKLGRAVANYARNQSAQHAFKNFDCGDKPSDEIDVLGCTFNDMAEQINRQLAELKRIDGLRREMVANISHDLRTPLTTMRGYLETLLLKYTTLSPDEMQQYLQIALRNSRHLGDMIEELFELAKLDSCESIVCNEPFSISELVQDVVNLFKLKAEKKSIHLEANLHPDTPLIFGDIAMMQRVLENLLENCLRHTQEGGHIVINVDVSTGKVAVNITDDGSGIAEQDLPRVFERFYQQDSSRSESSNSGLGLAIVKRILELHGTDIDVKSELNKGTTFSFDLATAD